MDTKFISLNLKLKKNLNSQKFIAGDDDGIDIADKHMSRDLEGMTNNSCI